MGRRHAAKINIINFMKADLTVKMDKLMLICVDRTQSSWIVMIAGDRGLCESFHGLKSHPFLVVTKLIFIAMLELSHFSHCWIHGALLPMMANLNY